jgi:hypothetical protein
MEETKLAFVCLSADGGLHLCALDVKLLSLRRIRRSPARGPSPNVSNDSKKGLKLVVRLDPLETLERQGDLRLITELEPPVASNAWSDQVAIAQRVVEIAWILLWLVPYLRADVLKRRARLRASEHVIDHHDHPS